MSRRASLFKKEHPEEKKKTKVRFPDELVFLDSIKEHDVDEMHSMLRRVSVQIDINAIGSSGMAPLHQAVTEENLAAVQLLVKTGADINKQDEDSWTPLHAACANGFTDIVRFLLQSGADRNILTEDGERPYDLIESDDMATISVMLASCTVLEQDDSEEEAEGDDVDSGAGSLKGESHGEDEEEDEEEYIGGIGQRLKIHRDSLTKKKTGDG